MPPLLELLPPLLSLVPTLDLLPLILRSCQTSRSCWTSGLLPLLLDLVPLLAKLDLLLRHICLLKLLPFCSDERLSAPLLLLLATSSTSMMRARTQQKHGAHCSMEVP